MDFSAPHCQSLATKYSKLHLFFRCLAWKYQAHYCLHIFTTSVISSRHPTHHLIWQQHWTHIQMPWIYSWLRKGTRQEIWNKLRYLALALAKIVWITCKVCLHLVLEGWLCWSTQMGNLNGRITACDQWVTVSKFALFMKWLSMSLLWFYFIQVLTPSRFLPQTLFSFKLVFETFLNVE